MARRGFSSKAGIRCFVAAGAAALAMMLAALPAGDAAAVMSNRSAAVGPHSVEAPARELSSYKWKSRKRTSPGFFFVEKAVTQERKGEESSMLDTNVTGQKNGVDDGGREHLKATEQAEGTLNAREDEPLLGDGGSDNHDQQTAARSQHSNGFSETDDDAAIAGTSQDEGEQKRSESGETETMKEDEGEQNRSESGETETMKEDEGQSGANSEEGGAERSGRGEMETVKQDEGQSGANSGDGVAQGVVALRNKLPTNMPRVGSGTQQNSQFKGEAGSVAFLENSRAEELSLSEGEQATPQAQEQEGQRVEIGQEGEERQGNGESQLESGLNGESQNHEQKSGTFAQDSSGSFLGAPMRWWPHDPTPGRPTSYPFPGDMMMNRRRLARRPTTHGDTRRWP